VEDNAEDENGREDENREEMVHVTEVTPNLMASTLKQPSCGTSMDVVKYLAMKIIFIFFGIVA